MLHITVVLPAHQSELRYQRRREGARGGEGGSKFFYLSDLEYRCERVRISEYGRCVSDLSWLFRYLMNWVIEVLLQT